MSEIIVPRKGNISYNTVLLSLNVCDVVLTNLATGCASVEALPMCRASAFNKSFL